MNSKKAVKWICIIEDLYVIIVATMVLFNKNFLISNDVGIILVIVSIAGMIYPIITELRNRKWEANVISTLTLVVLVAFYLLFRPW